MLAAGERTSDYTQEFSRYIFRQGAIADQETLLASVWEQVFVVD